MKTITRAFGSCECFVRLFSFVEHSGFTLTIQVFHLTFLALGILTWCTAVIFVDLKPEDGAEMLMSPESRE